MFTKTISPPDPTPCMALPTMIMVKLVDTAHIRLATRNTKLARSKIGFLPQISLIFPHRGVQAAQASRYEEATQEYPLWLALKCAAMAGKAVATMV
jgi:hypothetical protein